LNSNAARADAVCLLIVIMGALILPAGAQPANPGPDVSVESALNADAVHPGGVLRVAVQVKLGAGWHVNAHKPLDEYLVPTALTFTPPEGVTVRETVYPDPITINLEGTSEELAAYESQFAIGVEVAVAGTVQLEPTRSKANCNIKPATRNSAFRQVQFK